MIKKEKLSKKVSKITDKQAGVIDLTLSESEGEEEESTAGVTERDRKSGREIEVSRDYGVVVFAGGEEEKIDGNVNEERPNKENKTDLQCEHTKS